MVEKMKLHSACKLFPLLPDQELQELANDIKSNGLINPIVTFDGKILDGQNRFAACKLAKVKPRYKEFKGNDPVEWVISQNLMRRHLTTSQRAVLGFELLPMLEKEAKKRQKKGTLANKCAKGKSSETAARIVKSNARYVEMLKSISTTSPELIPKVKSGELTVLEAQKLINATIQDAKTVKPKIRTVKQRIKATRLIHGECLAEMKKLRSNSIDLILTDPPYPEINREYGKLTEDEWHKLMHAVVNEGRRLLKPTGSMVIILQPNFEKIGKMRIWLWEFLAWVGREWNVVQDAYWWNHGCLPSASSNRKHGLMRQSMKMCVWLGDSNCYRNQDNVLCLPSNDNFSQSKSDSALRISPSGHHYRGSRIATTVAERGGSTPFNLLPVAAGGGAAPKNPHPASTPYEVAAWWVKYLLPKNGVLLDPFAGSGTMLLTGLDYGAKQVIGIEQKKKYLRIAEKRICE